MADSGRKFTETHLNSQTFGGRLGADPVLRSGGGGQSVCSYRVLNSRMVNGEIRTSAIEVVQFGKQAEAAAANLQKGREVTVIGTLSVSGYLDTNSPEAQLLIKNKLAEGIRRTRTSIIARDVQWGRFTREQQAAMDAARNVDETTGEVVDPAASPDVPAEA